MSSYRHDPFKDAKRRRKKKSSLNSPAKRRVKGLFSKTNTISSHRKIIYDPSSSSDSDISSEDEEESFDAPQY